MKLPRTIRLDPSDTFVFDRPAAPDEWAVSGSFLFLDCKVEELAPKARHAFRSGFLGVSSLGFSTLAVVKPVEAEQVEQITQELARGFCEQLGAPDMEAARAAARGEIEFAASLCDHPEGTLLAVQRSLDDKGELREQFRTLRPREAHDGQDALHAFARAFTFHEVEDNAASPQVEDHVDLAALMARPASGPDRL